MGERRCGARVSDADATARRVADHLLALEGTGPLWGIVIENVSEGYARIRMTVRSNMLNGLGTAHGGMIFALADTAFAYACNSRNETNVAQSAAITFLSPVQEGETLIAEARERARQGRSAIYAVSVQILDGRVVAEFLGSSRATGGQVIEETRR